MRRIIALIFAISFVPLALHAGGSSFNTRIHEWREISKGEYRVVVDWPTKGTVARRVVYLRHSRAAFLPTPSPHVSKANYEQCISILRNHFSKGETFPFGMMGRGFVDHGEEKGALQSNSLALLEEHNGRKVCYSFANTP